MILILTALLAGLIVGGVVMSQRRQDSIAPQAPTPSPTPQALSETPPPAIAPEAPPPAR